MAGNIQSAILAQKGLGYVMFSSNYYYHPSFNQVWGHHPVIVLKVAIIIGQLCQRLPVANLRLREWPDVYCLSTVYDTFNAASFNMTEHCKAKPLHCTDNKISIRLTTKTRKQSTTQRTQQNITLR